MLKSGFYCALGTPLDPEGMLIEKSLCQHIESQISNGASGLLVMGSMGMLGCVRSDQYERVVRTAAEANGGRVTLMAGAADNSIARVRERIDQIKKYDVALVVTAPYYFSLSRLDAMRYFTETAAYWGRDMYIYDHPWTARYKCTLADILELMKIKNIKGIKSGDMVLIKALMESPETREDFTPIFSNSDLFVVGRPFGISRYLDGIFACFPKTAGLAEKAYSSGDFTLGKKYIDSIMAARDAMVELNLWPAFTCAMNLLGFEGNFGPDYDVDFDTGRKKRMTQIMQQMGEI